MLYWIEIDATHISNYINYIELVFKFKQYKNTNITNFVYISWIPLFSYGENIFLKYLLVKVSFQRKT